MEQAIKTINLEIVKSVLANSTTERATFKVENYSNLDEFLLLMYSSCCDSDMVLDEDLRKNISNVGRWLKGELKTSIMFSGKCGNGKTTMVKMLQKAVPMLTQNRYYVSFVSSLDLVDIAQNAEQDYRRLKTAQILAIDDVGAEPSVVKRYGNELSPTTDIIYYRYDNRMPTIISTNLRKNDIENVYGERIADRVNGFFTNLVFKQTSYRK